MNMEADIIKLYNERDKRIKDVVALKIPDRVPFAPRVSGFYANGYGISQYEAMSDIRNLKPGVTKFLEAYKPDLVRVPSFYPRAPLETLQCQFIKWPGAEHNLPLTSSFQILDGGYVEDDEFEELAFDPTHFFITKIFPRKNKALKGFQKLYLRNPVEYSFLSDFAVFADPEVKESLLAAIQAGEQIRSWNAGKAYLAAHIESMGFPLGPKFAQTCPFDMFCDNYRGLINTIMDIKERPEELLLVLDKLTQICLERTIQCAQAANASYVSIPLHAGVDEFMSCADYEKFYWPGLKKMMDAIIAAGMIPYVFCQGNYNSRLEILSDVPKGKVVYMFEKVDIAKAKKIVGQNACICGNLPTATLAFGTREETVEECKKLLDVCAPGGGFIMDCSMTIDNALHENLEAMAETTLTYGKY